MHPFNHLMYRLSPKIHERVFHNFSTIFLRDWAMHWTENLFIFKKVLVSYAEPVMTAATCEAVQMIDQVLRAHYHLKSRYGLLTGWTETSLTKQPANTNK